MPPTPPFTPTASLDDVMAHSAREPVVLYKHSAYCGISMRACRQLAQLNEPDDPPVYEVVVQEDRALSKEVAERLGVRHETPQVIVLHEGRPVFHTSHHRVTAQAVRDALESLSS